MNLLRMDIHELADLRDKINFANGHDDTAKVTASGHLEVITNFGGIIIPKIAEVTIVPPVIHEPANFDDFDENADYSNYEPEEDFRGNVVIFWDDYTVCISENFVGITNKYFDFEERR